MGDQKIDVTVRMNRESGWTADELEGHRRDRWKIEIQDRASGVMLAVLHLTDEQWAAMHTGTGGEGSATVPPVEILRRVGKTGWNVSVPMDYAWNASNPDFTPGYGSGHRNDHGLMVHVQNLGLASMLGGDSVSTTRHNNGLSVTVRGYADTPELAVDAAAVAAERLNEVATDQAWKNVGKVHANPTLQSLEHDRQYSDYRQRDAT